MNIFSADKQKVAYIEHLDWVLDDLLDEPSYLSQDAWEMHWESLSLFTKDDYYTVGFLDFTLKLGMIYNFIEPHRILKLLCTS